MKGGVAAFVAAAAAEAPQRRRRDGGRAHHHRRRGDRLRRRTLDRGRESAGHGGRAGRLRAHGERAVRRAQGRAVAEGGRRGRHRARLDAGARATTRCTRLRARCNRLALLPFRRRRPIPCWASRRSTSVRFHGGLNINSVPDRAEIEIDLRTIPGIDHATLRARHRAHMEEDLRIETLVDLPGVWTSPQDAVGRARRPHRRRRITGGRAGDEDRNLLQRRLGPRARHRCAAHADPRTGRAAPRAPDRRVVQRGAHPASHGDLPRDDRRLGCELDSTAARCIPGAG